MAKKTISQALKDLFLGLGGDSSALADNTSASDYIQDLESAIKATASGASADLIDDETASEETTYSSSKIESLIPDNAPIQTTYNNDTQLATIDDPRFSTWGEVANYLLNNRDKLVIISDDVFRVARANIFMNKAYVYLIYVNNAEGSLVATTKTVTLTADTPTTVKVAIQRIANQS